MSPAEVDALFRDLSIGVTSFFRDPQAFDALETDVIPRLFAGKSAGAKIRVWVPGCSTGQEPYSIAILLAERMQAMKSSFDVQVFATDIDGEAIDKARRGVYPANLLGNLSAERRGRFFADEPGKGPGHASNYRVRQSIRDLLVFSEHDVLEDPPFSRLDLISCRNVMIYMGVDLQKSLVHQFHHALNPAGVLFVGTSETLGGFPTLFAARDRGARVYQRRDDHLPTLPPIRHGFRAAPAHQSSNAGLPASNVAMQGLIEELKCANEELEASQDELRTVNDELTVVNDELHKKVAELSQANNDMNTLLAVTGVGIVFVDLELRIRRFTPAITQVINLIPADVGRPVGHLVWNLVGYDLLVEDLRAVLDTLIPRELEVQNRAGRRYSLRIRPYRTLENVIEGAVVTLFDIERPDGGERR